MDAALIPQVRSFNRIAVERAGALNGRFLGRKRPVGEARLLWEIGGEGANLRDLRARLGLDSGYLSRLLRALEADGLVTVTAGSGDGRIRRASLTGRGREEWTELDTRSDAFAAGMLEPLGERQRRELVDAMATVERYLTASMISVQAENPLGRDARHCLEQYFGELHERFDDGFEEEFDVETDARRYRPPAGVLLLARLRGRPVGCGALRFDERGWAEVKRLWVSPPVRGLGLGRRLLADLEARAAAAGAAATRLDTNRNLSEAIALYRSTGYREIERYTDEPYAHHWFEKEL